MTATYSWDEPKDPGELPRGAKRQLTQLQHSITAVRDNLDAARQRLDGASDPDETFHLLLTVAGLCEISGTFQDGRDAARQAVDVARDAADLDREVAALNAFAVLLGRCGELGEAVEALETAHDRISVARDDGRAAAVALANLAVLRANEDQRAAALALLDQAFRICRKVDEPRISGSVLNNAGAILAADEGYDAAAWLYQRAALLRQRGADIRGLAQTHNNLGLVHTKVGSLVGAIPFLEMASVTLAEVGDLPSLLITLSNNIVAFEKYHLEPAHVLRDWFRDAIELMKAVQPAPTADAAVLPVRPVAVLLPNPNASGDVAADWGILPDGAALLSNCVLGMSVEPTTDPELVSATA